MNTQPWLFQFNRGRLELHADNDRQVRVLDPQGRQLFMSCGAALLNLRLALAQLSYEPDVALFPDTADPLLVATVAIGRIRALTADARALYAAIANRRSNRRPFSPESPSKQVLARLAAAAEFEGARFTVLNDNLRKQAVDAVQKANRTLMADPTAREEVARWIGPRAAAGEGIPVAALGLVPLGDWALVRDYATMTGQLDRPASHYERNPTVALITTPGDDPVDWVRAGQALERVHLSATHLGLALSYLGQPFEVDDPWAVPGSNTSVGGVAQMVLRLGYAAPSAATPRRPVEGIFRLGSRRPHNQHRGAAGNTTFFEDDALGGDLVEGAGPARPTG